jgi:hypothetical protein
VRQSTVVSIVDRLRGLFHVSAFKAGGIEK